MKTAVAIAAAALLLLAVLLLRRRSGEPVFRRPPPAPAIPAAVPAAETLAAPSTAAPAPLPSADAGASLLDELIRAARRGDQKRVRELLARLRAELLPPVPDEENAATLIEKALGLLGGMIPRDLGRKGYDALLMGRAATPEELADIRAFLESKKEAVAEATRLLREAAERPRARFSLDPAGSLHPPESVLLRSQSAANLLLIQATLARLEGRRDEAASLTRAALGLGRALHQEASAGAQMIACAVEIQSWEALQRERLLDAPAVAAHVAALDPRAIPQAVDRCLLGEAYELARSAGDLSTAAAGLQALRDMQGLSAGRYEDMRLPLEALSKTAAAAGTSMPFTLRVLVTVEIRFSMLRAAAAVEDYRSRRGVYPETTAALGVDVPLDPSNGRPFAYRREGDGYTLDVTGEVPLKHRLLWRSGR